LEAIIYTAFGWVLGFFGTLLLQRINQKKRKYDFKESLCVEFREAIPQLAGTYYLLKETLGELDRDVLKWTQSMFSKFSKNDKKVLRSIATLLKRTDDELKALARKLIYTIFT